jgi:UDP-N-acetylglucosamine--N-acetylmuramyl-(pentapeptide) pyrophosphoryl-undecaprenol N-acetylglucosamine transferase
MRLLIAGGGTGGHLFPGVALAEHLRELDKDAPILFVGTARGIEARELPRLGWPLELITVRGVKTKGVVGAVRGLLSIPAALWQSRRILKKFKPDVVIGVGGYASAPVVLMARLLGIPTGVMEQNSIPGLANRWLGKVCGAVFATFDESRRFFPEHKILMTGNPVRLAISRALLAPPQATPSTPRLLVVGGSQGAVAVNQVVIEAMKLLKQKGFTPALVHHTGKTGFEEARKAYADAGIDATCSEFIQDMASAYLDADLVIARAGATTVAELALAGLPAIFIPYPHAADNHQEKNAEAVVAAGGAVLFRQSELTATTLAETIHTLLGDRERLNRMRSAMKSMARADAAKGILDWCLEQSRVSQS